jgi:hypothetical protein
VIEIFQFIQQVPYLSEAVNLLLAGHALAVAIVNLTPTPKDDEFVAKAYTYIEMLAGLVSKKAKQ